MDTLTIIMFKDGKLVFGYYKDFPQVCAQGDTEIEVLGNLNKYLTKHINQMPMYIDREQYEASENRLDFLLKAYNESNYNLLKVEDLKTLQNHYVKEQDYEEAVLLRDLLIEERLKE